MSDTNTTAKTIYAITCPCRSRQGYMCMGHGATPEEAWQHSFTWFAITTETTVAAYRRQRELRGYECVAVPETEWDHHMEQPDWCVIP